MTRKKTASSEMPLESSISPVEEPQTSQVIDEPLDSPEAIIDEPKSDNGVFNLDIESVSVNVDESKPSESPVDILLADLWGILNTANIEQPARQRLFSLYYQYKNKA